MGGGGRGIEGVNGGHRDNTVIIPSFDKRQGTIKQVRGVVEAPGPSVCVPATSKSSGCRV